MLDYKQLQDGKGKGKRVHWTEMIKRETTSNRNATWFMNQYDSDATIKEIYYDEILDKMRCVFSSREKDMSLYSIKNSIDEQMQELIQKKSNSLNIAK